MAGEFHIFEQMRKFDCPTQPRAWPAVDQPAAEAMHQDPALIFFLHACAVYVDGCEHHSRDL
jgi:hypothetical protein